MSTINYKTITTCSHMFAIIHRLDTQYILSKADYKYLRKAVEDQAPVEVFSITHASLCLYCPKPGATIKPSVSAEEDRMHEDCTVCSIFSQNNADVTVYIPATVELD